MTQKSVILGIDLGTTHSLVAVVRDGRPEVIPVAGSRLLPSVVHFGKSSVEVGNSAKRFRTTDPRNTVFSPKRLLGRSAKEIEALGSKLPYEIAGEQVARAVVAKADSTQAVSAVEISAMILSELKKAAQSVLGNHVKQAVITVPAYFNDAQRQATRAAGRLAGLEVVRILNEPTAAALAYGYRASGKAQTLAVYDLGGGTFDCSILRIENGIFEVLSTRGDTSVGGDDFDREIANRWRETILKAEPSRSEADLELWAQIVEESEQAKIALVGSEQVRKSISGVELSVTRNEFSQWIRPWLLKTAECARLALKDANLETSALDAVVLVGGPTRLPMIREFVRDVFGKEPDVSAHPDEAIVIGAAIQADILAGNNRETLLLDVVPLSLGIEAYGGVMSTLISRNSKIPAVATELFSNFVDGQNAVDLHVLQGERDRASDNRSLARFKLSNLEPLSAGAHRIRVQFLVDADGILQVTARDERTGRESSVEVKPSFGLSDQEIERMLSDKQNHAREDVEYRVRVEAVNSGERVLRSTEKGIAVLAQARSGGSELLSAAELQVIEDRVAKLRKTLVDGGPNDIREATTALNQVTVRLAEIVVRVALGEHRDTQG